MSPDEARADVIAWSIERSWMTPESSRQNFDGCFRPRESGIPPAAGQALVRPLRQLLGERVGLVILDAERHGNRSGH